MESKSIKGKIRLVLVPHEMEKMIFPNGWSDGKNCPGNHIVSLVVNWADRPNLIIKNASFQGQMSVCPENKGDFLLAGDELKNIELLPERIRAQAV